jgi:GNAT superfamily N-acetyltransferase
MLPGRSALAKNRMTSAQTLPLEPLAPDLVAGTASLLADAMDDDPAYGFMLPPSRARRARLADFFERNLLAHMPYRCTYVALDAQQVVGTVTVRPPGGITVSLWTMLRRGLLPFAVANGASAVRRLLTLRTTYDGLEADHLAGGPHWLVHMMGVAPSRQGTGLGSSILRRALAATADAADRTACPVGLTTHKERNVVFYRRAGFVVVDERELELAPGRPYRVWTMRRA